MTENEVLSFEAERMHPLHIIYLNGPDLARLALGDEEILRAVEQGLDALGAAMP